MQNEIDPNAPVYARTIPNSAKAMGIGVSTLWRLIANGEIRTISINRRRLIAETELQRFIRDRVEAANA